jgi:DNA (cytosine-5)-methyltransferase 1
MLVFGEQVSSAIKFGWCDRLFDDMESEGYIGWSCVLGAHSVGAPHERQRLYWAFANTADHGLEGVQRRIEAQVSKDWTPEALAAWNTTGSAFGDWRKLLAEPNVCRVDDGVSSTVDIRPRLHAYGNAIVPQVGALFVRSFIGGLLEKS